MKKDFRFVIVTIFAVVFFAGRSAWAQQEQPSVPSSEPMSTERGGFSNGTETVTPGHLQLEAGYLYHKANGTHDQSPDDGTQLRFGLRSRFEVRFGLPSYRYTRDQGHEDTGWDDTTLGLKWRFREDAKSFPAIAVIGSLALPTGKHDTGERYLQPEIALEASKELDGAYSLDGAFVYTDAHQGHEQFNQFAGGFVLSRHLTSVLDVFAQVYRVMPQDGKGGANANYVGGGFIYQLNRSTIFDIGLDNGISRPFRAETAFTTGISHRW